MTVKRIDIKALFGGVSSKLMEEFRQTEALSFAPDRGYPREDAVRKFLEAKLPKRYGVGKGFIVNSLGEQSRQTDVIIYDAETTPILYSDPGQEIFPVESVYATIEVKSRLSQKALSEGITNVIAFKEIKREEVKSLAVGRISWDYKKPFNPKISAIIAYSSDQDSESRPHESWKSEIIAKLEETPLGRGVDCVCIIDRGIFLPLQKHKEGLNIAFGEASSASWEFVSDPKYALVAFVCILITKLNDIKLGRVDLMDYFRQSFNQGG